MVPEIFRGVPKDPPWTLRLRLPDAIYRPNSFVMMLRYCVNLKAIRYESASLNRIVADKSHGVILALNNKKSLDKIGLRFSDSKKLQVSYSVKGYTGRW